jgi:hypothetical protein
MNRFCQQCAEDISNNLPLSHCFYEKIDKINDITVFNACPGESKLYNDVDGILSHIKAMLQHHGNNQWVLHIDGENFDTKHAAQITIVYQFIELIKKESKRGVVAKEFYEQAQKHIEDRIEKLTSDKANERNDKLRKALGKFKKNVRKQNYDTIANNVGDRHNEKSLLKKGLILNLVLSSIHFK